MVMIGWSIIGPSQTPAGWAPTSTWIPRQWTMAFGPASRVRDWALESGTGRKLSSSIRSIPKRSLALRLLNATAARQDAPCLTGLRHQDLLMTKSWPSTRQLQSRTSGMWRIPGKSNRKLSLKSATNTTGLSTSSSTQASFGTRSSPGMERKMLSS